MPGAKKSGRAGGTAKPARSKKAANGKNGSYSPEIEDAIRNRAYQLYEQRGGAGGSAMQDWLEAEAEVLRAGKKR